MIITWSISLLLLLGQSAQVSANLSASRLVIIDNKGTTESCSSHERRDAIFQHITASFHSILSDSFLDICGPGEWYRVARLNMSDPLQQCPSAWREYNTSGVRACGTQTPGTDIHTCLATSYPVVSTAECVEELLAIRLEVQTPLAIKQLHNHLTPTMSMESVSLMEHLVTTFGPMLLVCLKGGMLSKAVTVHAAILVILTMHTHYRLLETTTTVNLAIQQIRLFTITFVVEINSGMVSSVKVCVAAMENLLHGSVWSYPTQQLMILRCVFAVV